MVSIIIEDTTFYGPTIDLTAYNITPNDVLTALHTNSPEISISTTSPGPVHDRLGCVHEEKSYQIRSALAAVARQRGYTTAYDSQLERVQERLSSIDLTEVTFDHEHQRLAQKDNIEQLQEEISALRGRIQELRQQNKDPEGKIQQLQQQAGELSAKQTKYTAAKQALEQKQKQLRDMRDKREKRLKLQDKQQNLRRKSRRVLARKIRPQFIRSLDSIPGEYELSDTPGTVETGETTAALAIYRLSRSSAPVVLASSRFPNLTAATAALDAPVIRCSP